MGSARSTAISEQPHIEEDKFLDLILTTKYDNSFVSEPEQLELLDRNSCCYRLDYQH